MLEVRSLSITKIFRNTSVKPLYAIKTAHRKIQLQSRTQMLNKQNGISEVEYI
jgi:hypothetical protein